MWLQLRGIVLLCVLFVCSSFASVSHAISAIEEQRSVELTYEEYSQVSNNLNQLQNNSTKQLERINQLETLLQTASLSTTESNRALIEARQQLSKAKQQTQEQAQQLAKLNESLQMQSQQLQKANASLATANESLSELRNELKSRQRAEKRNKILLAIAATTAVYLATK